jgi:hypothetical protein
LKENYREIAGAVRWDPDDLTVDRFGLNADFIEEQGLPWIEGLKTGSGQDLGSPRHAHYNRPYVQEYIRRYGKRKVEANALVTRPEAGRRLFREAIHRYLSPDSPKEYEQQLDPIRQDLRAVPAEKVREWADLNE